MTDWVLGDWIVQGGAVGLLGVGVLMVYTGRLVPRATYRDMEKDRDTWREVALKAIGHADQLLPGAQIASEVVRALSTSPGVPRSVNAAESRREGTT